MTDSWARILENKFRDTKKELEAKDAEIAAWREAAGFGAYDLRHISAASANEARETIDRLMTDRGEKLDAVRAQLPEGMEHCTIVFKRCEIGHGRLIATNWTDPGCSKCALDAKDEEVERLSVELQWDRKCIGSRDERLAAKDAEIGRLKAEIARDSTEAYYQGPLESPDEIKRLKAELKAKDKEIVSLQASGGAPMQVRWLCAELNTKAVEIERLTSELEAKDKEIHEYKAMIAAIERLLKDRDARLTAELESKDKEIEHLQKRLADTRVEVGEENFNPELHPDERRR